MKLLTKSILLAIALQAGAASAETEFSDKISFNGFGTIGAAYMGGDQRDFGKSGSIENGLSFHEDTRLGGQLSYQASDSLVFTGQARIKGLDNKFETDLTWLYAKYNINTELTVAAGRMVLPAFLISDSIDIGYAQLTVRPASEMYDLVRVDYYEGLDFSYQATIADHTVNFQLFGGKASEQDILLGGQDATFEADSLFGINTTLELEYGNIRAGYVSVEMDFNAVSAGVILNDTDADYISLGYKFEFDNWITSAEFGRVNTKNSTGDAIQQGFYFTNGYRIGEFTPYITLAQNQNKSFDDTKQNSVMIGSRWNFADSMALKAEYQHVNTSNFYGHFETTGAFGENGYFSPALGFPQEGDADIFSVSLDFVF